MDGACGMGWGNDRAQRSSDSGRVQHVRRAGFRRNVLDQGIRGVSALCHGCGCDSRCGSVASLVERGSGDSGRTYRDDRACRHGAKDEAAKKAALESFFRVLMPIRSLYMVNLFLGLILIGIKAKRSIDQDGREP
jgi:hypothetical protein